MIGYSTWVYPQIPGRQRRRVGWAVEEVTDGMSINITVRANIVISLSYSKLIIAQSCAVARSQLRKGHASDFWQSFLAFVNRRRGRLEDTIWLRATDGIFHYVRV